MKHQLINEEIGNILKTKEVASLLRVDSKYVRQHYQELAWVYKIAIKFQREYDLKQTEYPVNISYCACIGDIFLSKICMT